jgi:site-specific DNA-cytosine methylase
MTQRPTHLDLFSGIGGFALAAQWAGFRTIAFCEVDKFCQRVLEAHWPEVRRVEKIQDLKGREFKGVSLVTGGFPCQPVSRAGKRRGTKDNRWLWPQMRRVIKEAQPIFVVAENVPGLTELGLDLVFSDLESEGYQGGVFSIPACAIGAPIIRERLFLVFANSARFKRPERCGVCSPQDAAEPRTNESLRPMFDSWPQGPHEVTEIPPFVDGFSDRLAGPKRQAIGNAVSPILCYELLREIRRYL